MTFLNDQETKVDMLYYESIARTLTTLVRETPLAPITIGVHGDWGAGKSSILKMVETGLDKEKDIVVVWFNGWAFEGYEDSKAVLIESLLEQIRLNRKLSSQALALMKSLIKRVDMLKVAKIGGTLAFNYMTSLPAVGQLQALLEAGKKFAENPADSFSAGDVKIFTQSVGGILKDPPAATLPENLHKFRTEFEELIQEAGIKQLVVLIDDLDRCLPQTAIATLEAIRLFLFVPKTAFVIATDEAMIEYAVRRHFPNLPASSGAQSYTRNYLEKLIQVPFRIPALGSAETHIYVTLLLVTLELTDEDAQKLISTGREQLKRPWQSKGLDKSAVEKALGAQTGDRVQLALDLSRQVSRILYEGTRGNPRQIKRFLNTLMLRHEIAKARGFEGDINRLVLAKLMLAERFEPTLYEELAREVAASPDGVVASLKAAEEPKKRSTEEAVNRDRDAGRDEWIERWHALSPPLVGKDLRPYFFLTRDKRLFISGPSGSEALESIIERLMGSRVAVRTVREGIRQFAPNDAEAVFDEVRSRMMQNADMKKGAPSGAYGLIELVQQHPALQRRLLEVLRGLPVERLGAWAAGHWQGAFTDQTLRSEYDAVLEQWARSDNAPLKTALELGMAVTGKKK